MTKLVDILLIQTAVCVTVVLGVLLFYSPSAQAQDHFHYTVPMLQDTVVVITNRWVEPIHVAVDWYNDQGVHMETQTVGYYLTADGTGALWYCLPVGDVPWFSLQLTSSLPLSIEKYMDREIAQGCGCP